MDDPTLDRLVTLAEGTRSVGPEAGSPGDDSDPGVAGFCSARSAFGRGGAPITMVRPASRLSTPLVVDAGRLIAPPGRRRKIAGNLAEQYNGCSPIESNEFVRRSSASGRVGPWMPSDQRPGSVSTGLARPTSNASGSAS